MDDILIQMWAHNVYRRLILSSVVWMAASVLGRVLPWLASSRLPGARPHSCVIRKIMACLGPAYPVDTDARPSFRSEISQHISAEFATVAILVASRTAAVLQFPSTTPQGQPLPAASPLYGKLDA